MRILLTGFEPFGGSDVNPSQQIVQALAGEHAAGIDLRTAILPVDGATAPVALIAAVQTHQPDAVVCLGQASRRAVLSLERVAINLLDYTIPDNTGKRIVDEPVASGGPAAYFATLPLRAMLAAIRAANVPAELSLSAGTFLCNQVLYTLLHHIAVTGLPTRGGFLHVPSLPEQAAREPRPIPSMSLETMVRGVSAAISALG